MSMIKKKDLKPGTWYQGECRNASIAYWMEKEQHFIHIRHKFGDTFIETIKHPEDEDQWDTFIPMKRIEEIPGEVFKQAIDDFHALEEKQKEARDAKNDKTRG